MIDLRWLAPLPEAAILDAIRDCDHVLVVDECRRTGSQSEALMTMLHENSAANTKLKRLTAEDSFIPLGPAATVCLPNRESIVSAALSLTEK